MSKLNRYRASQRDVSPSSLANFFKKTTGIKKRSVSLDEEEQKEKLIQSEPIASSSNIISIDKSSRESVLSDDTVILDDDRPVPGSCCGPIPWTSMDYAILTLKICIYILGQIVAIMIEFGAVFFVISLLYLIWYTLDDRKRAKHELSAYSVFNPGFQELRGTVTSQQLTAELTFGALHNY